MEATLVNQHAAVAALCREFGVEKLEVFGSAAVGSFDPASSDYDFIARFVARPGVSMARRFLGFNEALEALLERKVDLMTDHAIENPYLRAAVDASRKTVYAEAPAEAPV
ncbi:MAG: nucleotidyltransferase domain-containing protein [Bacteriovorax sp.]|nr:nucleotidyltransferase domain-containing protein [Rhizobacter sp.]